MSIADILQMGLEQYADIGFTLVIGGVCLRTLLFDREVNVKQRAVWKQELRELEKSLRLLIDEASHASHQFDSQLSQKQIHIQKLLDKAETLLKTSISNATVSQGRKSNSDAQRRNAAQRDLSSRQELRSDYDLDDWTYGERIYTEDTQGNDFIFEEEQQGSYTRNKRQHTKKDQSILEAKKIEQMKNEERKKQEALADEKIFAQTSIVDPVAYKIAKRLLLEGKELHVIARKLEMPVSEIRHLETLIRQQAQADQAELPETFRAKNIETVKKVIRDRGTKKRERSSLVEHIEQVSIEKEEDFGLVFEDENDLPLTLEK